jgi:tetratricopeptide (TPR) repeat protein
MRRPSSRSALAAVLVVALLAFSAVACSGGDDEQAQASADLALALKAHQEGRLDDAIELYKSVIALDPGNKYAYYNLGLIHQTRGAYPLAEGEYRGVIAIDPEFVPALFNLAVLQAERGEPEEAIDLYRRVLVIQPDNAAAHLNLGFALLDAGQRAEGKAELQQAVDLDPTLASRIPDKVAADLEPPAGATPTATPTP